MNLSVLVFEMEAPEDRLARWVGVGCCKKEALAWSWVSPRGLVNLPDVWVRPGGTQRGSGVRPP